MFYQKDWKLNESDFRTKNTETAIGVGVLLGWTDEPPWTSGSSVKYVLGQGQLDACSRDGIFSVADVFKSRISPTSH